MGRPGDEDVFRDAAPILEELGYATIWLAGPSISGFEHVRTVVAATRNVQIAGGVISVDKFDAAEVATWHSELEATHPGRFIVGLGGAHGPKPLQKLRSYLDALDSMPPTVPAAARVLAALGPRMLQLARERAAGAYPLLVTPEYTARVQQWQQLPRRSSPNPKPARTDHEPCGVASAWLASDPSPRNESSPRWTSLRPAPAGRGFLRSSRLAERAVRR